MKAVRIHEFGDSNVLTLEDAPKPELHDGEVLIKVRAASVNPVDYKIRSGSFKKADIKLPATLGRDVAGVVEAVGGRVNGFKPGDDVYAYLSYQNGGYAEYAIAKSQEVAPKPVAVDYVHAAAVPLAAITAWQGLFDHGRLQPGQRVLIHGAAGGVGHYAVQFAKAKGATVIATAGKDDAVMLKQLGADEVIDYHSERFEDRARDVDLVLDLVGGDTQRRSWAVLKPGGRMVSTLEQPSPEQARARQAEGKVFMAEAKAEQLREIGRMIDADKVTVLVEKTLPLERAKEAHDTLENQHVRGKVVLTVP
ncbi:MAG TPA: NADP-dependent oxidoreductase [Opitutaceae bacterium]|nr:NADP-dependent oxidoreductase [Opitutaceae bacterium]